MGRGGGRRARGGGWRARGGSVGFSCVRDYPRASEAGRGPHLPRAGPDPRRGRGSREPRRPQARAAFEPGTPGPGGSLVERCEAARERSGRPLGECPSFNRCFVGRPLRAPGRLGLCASFSPVQRSLFVVDTAPRGSLLIEALSFHLRVCREALEAGPQSGRERSHRALHGQLRARLQPLRRQKRS